MYEYAMYIMEYITQYASSVHPINNLHQFSTFVIMCVRVCVCFIRYQRDSNSAKNEAFHILSYDSLLTCGE